MTMKTGKFAKWGQARFRRGGEIAPGPILRGAAAAGSRENLSGLVRSVENRGKKADGPTNAVGTPVRPTAWRAAPRVFIASDVPQGHFGLLTRAARLAPALLAALCFAQTPAPSFEVASVKPSPPPTGDVMIRRSGGDPGMVNYQNVTLKIMIARAYSVKNFQVSGPDWIDSQGYDVVAKLPAGASQDQVPAMLQTLLAERFKLALHRESKEIPVYALIVDKGGPKVKEADPKALAAAAATGGPRFAGNGPPPPPPGAGGRGMPAGTFLMRLGDGGARHMQGMMTMSGLTNMLSNFLDRPVLDMTGLTKTYDIELAWMPDDREQLRGPMGMMPPPGAVAAGAPPGMEARPAEAASDSASGTIFSALQQELGLKLDARKSQAEFLVVDHAEKEPTEN